MRIDCEGAAIQFFGIGMIFRNKTREFELHAQVHGMLVRREP